MTAPRRIVVGLDPVGELDAPVNVALDLAERFGAEVELVCGVTGPHHLWPDLEPHEVEAARATLATRLEACIAGTRLADALGAHELVVDHCRDPARFVLARAADADLIVLGSHRSRGFVDLSSTARSVLAGARCPTWVQSGPVRVVKRILVPVDLSDESLASLQLALSWARTLGAEVDVLHCFLTPDFAGPHGYPVAGPTYVVDKVRDDDQAEFEKAMAAVDWHDVPHTTAFVEGDPAACILERQDSVDLVFMGTHGRTGFTAALLGNVASTVIREGHVPVVAVRDPSRRWEP